MLRFESSYLKFEFFRFEIIQVEQGLRSMD